MRQTFELFAKTLIAGRCDTCRLLSLSLPQPDKNAEKVGVSFRHVFYDEWCHTLFVWGYMQPGDDYCERMSFKRL